MLICAFNIEVSYAIFGPICSVAQDKSMRGAAIKPNVQDIKHLRIVFRRHNTAQKALFRAFVIPSIRSFSLKSVQYAGVHLVIAQQIIFICG